MFEKHAALDKVVISDGHPYFSEYNIAKQKSKLKELDAQSNYGLPSVKHLYNQHKFSSKIEMGSEDEYRKWWKDQVNVKGTDDILLTDKTGLNILFDSVKTAGNNKKATTYFKDHIITKTNEQRWSYAANLTDILTDADEIWSTRLNNDITRIYLKYYNDAPYAIVVANKEGVMVAESMYQLTDERAIEFRRGELIHIKR